MTTCLITHPACLGHRPPEGHPERPARLRAVLDALDAEEFRGLTRSLAPLIERDALSRVHAPAYVDAVLAAIPASGLVQFDGDTLASPGSGEAALRAAGALVLGVDLVATGGAKNVFCAVRPPGHHALADRAMGFCLFNNVAVGAAHARAVHGLARIAVVDFDVHHGNGTEAMFADRPGYFFASTHQWPLYPGSGGPGQERSANILDVPLAPGSGGPELRQAFTESVLPALEEFRPELILISAGFDAHRADPLAGLCFENADFHWATEAVCALAARICEGRVVSTLEGGYDLAALAGSASAHVRALMAA